LKGADSPLFDPSAALEFGQALQRTIDALERCVSV
jgi:hypothetical protein